MPFVTFSDDYMLDQWGTNHGTHISLHSAYSSTGTNELSGQSMRVSRSPGHRRFVVVSPAPVRSLTR